MRATSSSVRRGLIVFVVAGGGLVNVVVVQELTALARVFAGDEVRFPQQSDGAIGDIFEISNGCRDYVEHARHQI